ncbi:MAG: ribosomal-processing cysteine protease Prp [Lachnospiraceae bacterium]|nr:ribosomal-processing cysteine protease Prp [Lachnospiraceae bacterium]
MIVIRFKSKNDVCYGLTTSGHAEFDEAGRDIVCAAASVLVINTLNSIEKFTSDTIEVDENQEDGRIDATITSSVSEESQLLFKSLRLGLDGIIKAYGDRYIKIND